ncbi:hypothetical protein RND81_12G065900 [Saponaria officinalis]|uniref:Uncharacterized protein n=1 Tax=Saponaria officinalis TaxID=3572 RepID=A0AAW1H7D4_SAPOF
MDIHVSNNSHIGLAGHSPFKTFYMIGDNPSVDIKGAHRAGRPWFSILTRTWVSRGEKYDHEFQADMHIHYSRLAWIRGNYYGFTIYGVMVVNTKAKAKVCVTAPLPAHAWPSSFIDSC